MYTDKEWDLIRQSWSANHRAIVRIIKSVRKDYKPGSNKNKKLKAVLKMEKSESSLVLASIDKFHEIDKILHRNEADTTVD